MNFYTSIIEENKRFVLYFYRLAWFSGNLEFNIFYKKFKIYIIIYVSSILRKYINKTASKVYARKNLQGH
jgi:hypothetical protein